TRTPIVLGVEGETKAIIEAAGAGIPITPEDAGELVEAVLRLRNDPALHAQMGERGYAFVHEHFNREKLARRYADLLARIAGRDSVRARPAPAEVEAV
ncbi:MAG: hypothetical protein D6746_07360, partial [Bacteroidetes bacterium]